MKWNTLNSFLQTSSVRHGLQRKYNLQKRSHRYALLQNSDDLQALISHEHKKGWALVDSLIADVLDRAAELSASTPERIRLGMYISSQEVKNLDVETVGIEALWTLPLRMDISVFQARPRLTSFNKQLELWLRGFRLGKLKDVEYGPLLAVAWMTQEQRNTLMSLMVIHENKKYEETRDPLRMMGAQYLLGCAPDSWDGHDYLAASHGVQRWMERLFFQTSPHQCFWIAKPNALLGEWFPDYWAAARGHQSHETVRENTLRGLNAMTFPLEDWYSWWSWHSLAASPTSRNKKWSFMAPTSTQNGIYRLGRQPLSRPNGEIPIDLDIVDIVKRQHPQMAAAYETWSGLALCAVERDAGDVKWVQTMWDMYCASLRNPEESLSVDGLL